MTTIKRPIQALGALFAAAGVGLSVQAQSVGLWQFDGNYNSANGGEAITEYFAKGEFGTTESFGIGAIDGASAQVLKFPEIAEPESGFTLPVLQDLSDPNTYTLIMDVYYPLTSNSKVRNLADLNTDYTDAEFSIGANNALIAGNAGGEIQPDTWHRVILVVDTSTDVTYRYLDGQSVGTWAIPPDLQDFGPQSIDAQLDILLFSVDQSGTTAEGYVNSVQLRDEAISAGQALALGKPTADGIPLVLPDVPSFIVGWTPPRDVASRDTDVGVVLNQGSTNIDQSSIKFTLDGE